MSRRSAPTRRIRTPPNCGWSGCIRQSQLAWLKGYCHPIRFNDLVKNNKVPAELLSKLPPPESYQKAVFPTLDQQAKTKETITKQWDSVVGVTVK